MNSMKKTILFIFLILYLATAFGSDCKKTKLAVVNFEKTGYSFKNEDMSKIVAEWFTTSKNRRNHSIRTGCKRI